MGEKGGKTSLFEGGAGRIRDRAGEPGGSRDRALFHSKMLSFRCASWKRVRIFEGISGVFQDAHFSKTVRIFEQRAHLRQGTALDPVPMTRKVAPPLSASVATT
jgi:hypothetical protein